MFPENNPNLAHGPEGHSYAQDYAAPAPTASATSAAEATLRAEIERLRLAQRELEDRQMVETSLGQLSRLLRWEVGRGVGEWTDIWLTEFAITLNAAQASVYFFHEGREDILVLAAAYAAPENIAKSIEMGYGSVGQAARDGRTFYVEDVTSIRSSGRTSLVELELKAVLVQPLIHNGKVVGVLDLGLLSALKPAHATLVNRLAEQVAGQWVSIRSQVQVERLLQDAREKGEQLAAQEEELRQNLEEMQATQEEVARRSAAAEAAARRTEAVMSASVDPIIVISERGIIQTFNVAARDLFGYTEEEVMGQNVSMLMPSPHTENHDGYLARYHETGEARVMGKNRELEARRKDGTMFPIELSINQAEVDGARIYVGVLRDITQRKMQEADLQAAFEELQASEEEMRQNSEELQATQEEMRRRELELQATLAAINNTLATIEFAMDGTVLNANRQFEQAIGYTLADIKGVHHRLFMKPEEAETEAYANFWKSLNAGIAQTGEFQRVAAGGRTVWISATYTPVMGPDAKPIRIMKLALDVTAQKMAALEHEAHVAAIQRSTATVEFDMQGNILNANDLFLSIMGYTWQEVKGKAHSMFVRPEELAGADYAAFWNLLRAGEFQAGEFKRMGKDGREVFIKGSYNPVPGPDGKPIKVVKVAIDTTEMHKQQTELMQMYEEMQASEEEVRQQAEELQAGQEEMRRRELGQQATLRAIDNTLATIEFAMDGSVLTANRAFLSTMGYTVEEIRGKHHRMFLTPEDVASTEYGLFWKHLNEGTAQQGEFRRVAAGGRPVWLRATYTPVMGPDGKPIRVMKLAQDITAEKMAALEHKAHLETIQRSTATVEFDMEGRLLWANDLFLNLMGYTLLEVKGQKHSTFVKPAERKSAEYAAFWKELKAGNFVAGEFERVSKDGKRVWIQGSYNPVIGPDGKPVKVVKVAIDTTTNHEQQAQLQQMLEEVQASEEEIRQNAEEMQATQEEMRRRELELQAAMKAIDNTLATIEFSMNGQILKANAQFATQTGYKLDKIVGEHHRKLMPKGAADTSEYAGFWKALNQGEAQEGAFERVAANGKRIVMHATYTPVLDAYGKPYKVIKLIQRIEPMAN